jgi:hypothetical protein
MLAPDRFRLACPIMGLLVHLDCCALASYRNMSFSAVLM